MVRDRISGTGRRRRIKRIACFCIPAHGHTNPMLPVVAALVKRGNRVRFYSFDAFRDKICAAGIRAAVQKRKYAALLRKKKQ